LIVRLICAVDPERATKGEAGEVSFTLTEIGFDHVFGRVIYAARRRSRLIYDGGSMLVRPAADDEIDAGRNVSGNTVQLIVIMIMSEP
jgi:hypothetical protein